MDEAAAEHFEHGASYKVRYKLFDDGDYTVKLVQRPELEEDVVDVVSYTPDVGVVCYGRHRGDVRGKQIEGAVVTEYDGPDYLFKGHTDGDIGRDKRY